ncbi:MAG: response regulator transcription factor [Proteiniphilum sp.]|jgi:DNA-binding NarL/FixJ family response regulator|nr:response regulator transcription factor [Proteiniphilum sp.]MDD4632339.1 response regulator transcription factor [Proteiniphilum sp.]
MIRVQLVDDHPLVVEGLVRIINDSKIACITGTASSLKECRRIIARCVPDVLLLDIGLPDGNGIDACAEILQAYPEVKILMLTGYSELNVITRSLENGALGYVLKNSTVEEIIEGICTVALGERFLCEEADILLRTKKKEMIILSRRERELLKLIAEGHTMNVISDRMCIGYETVKSYRKNIMAKLQVPNTAALVKYAVETKMV